MAYTAYETASNEALAEVASLCRHLTTSGSFDSNTRPTLTEVERFLTAGYRMVNLVLAEYGYTVPATDADAVGVLQHYNAIWAAAQCEYAQASAGFTDGGGNRGDRFMAEFWGEKGNEGHHPGIRSIVRSSAFQDLGDTKAQELSRGLSVGGVSKADKLTIATDSDMDQYAFTRRMHGNPGGTVPWDDLRSDR